MEAGFDIKIRKDENGAWKQEITSIGKSTPEDLATNLVIAYDRMCAHLENTYTTAFDKLLLQANVTRHDDNKSYR